MTVPANYGEHPRMDVNMVQQIADDSTMAAEQGSNWLADWGGANGYAYWARQPEADRMAYFAIQDGATTPSDITTLTGMSNAQANAAVTRLQNKGLVQAGQVTQ